MAQVRSTLHLSRRHGWRQHLLGGLFILVPVTVLVLVGLHAAKWLVHTAADIGREAGLQDLVAPLVLIVLLVVLYLVLGLLIGYLAERTVFRSVRARLDRGLMQVLPGYDRFRLVLAHRLGEAQLEPMLQVSGDTWSPVYLIEEDDLGRCLVMVPGVPGFDQGSLKVVPKASLRPLALSAKQMESILRNYGEGFLAMLPPDLPQ